MDFMKVSALIETLVDYFESHFG